MLGPLWKNIYLKSPLHIIIDQVLFMEYEESCVLIILLKFTNGLNGIHRRERRYLLFTEDTQWGVFATVSVPLHPLSLVSVGWFFEANYYNVDNSTYFEPLLGDIIIQSGRQERSTEIRKDFTRFRLYGLIESLLEKHGYLGRPCLLRAICENAGSNFLHNGLPGDLLHLILTPSTSALEDDIDDCFYEAEYKGLENQCDFYSERCSSSPLDTISIYFDSF